MKIPDKHAKRLIKLLQLGEHKSTDPAGVLQKALLEGLNNSEYCSECGAEIN